MNSAICFSYVLFTTELLVILWIGVTLHAKKESGLSCAPVSPAVGLCEIEDGVCQTSNIPSIDDMFSLFSSDNKHEDVAQNDLDDDLALPTVRPSIRRVFVRKSTPVIINPTFVEAPSSALVQDTADAPMFPRMRKSVTFADDQELVKVKYFEIGSRPTKMSKESRYEPGKVQPSGFMGKLKASFSRYPIVMEDGRTIPGEVVTSGYKRAVLKTILKGHHPKHYCRSLKQTHFEQL